MCRSQTVLVPWNQHDRNDVMSGERIVLPRSLSAEVADDCRLHHFPMATLTSCSVLSTLPHPPMDRTEALRSRRPAVQTRSK